MRKSERSSIELFLHMLAVSALLASLFVSFLYVRSTERYKTLLELSGARLVPSKVMILGDSIIQSVCDNDPQLENLAISGATVVSASLEAIARIRTSGATHAILAVGINDLRSGAAPDAVADAIIAAVAKLRAETTLRHIVVLSLLPIVSGTPAAAQASNEAIDSVNSRLQVASRRGEIEYLDVSGLVRNANGLRPDLTYDGLHLNGAGRGILRPIVQGLAR